MKNRLLLLAAGAFALSPASLLAQTAPAHGPGSTSGPDVTTGQPNQSCQTINGGNTGPDYPGHTTTAPGSAFNETDGIAGSMYAGSQPQNSNNTASVSQYDVACEMQPQ
jgi:hypothetical protein